MQGVNKYYIDTADMSIFLGKSSPIIKNNEIKDLENYTSAYSKLFGGEKDVSTVIHYVDDSEFNTLCENNGIDYNAFYGDSLKCVLLNNLTHKQDTTKVFTDNIIGKHIIQNSDYASDEKIRLISRSAVLLNLIKQPAVQSRCAGRGRYNYALFSVRKCSK